MQTESTITENHDIKRYTEANRAAWNEVMPLHQQAASARLDAAFLQPGHLALSEDSHQALQRIGVQGTDVAHLCCNNGIELLSIKNLGAARCVGFDISDVAIAEAQRRARLAGIDCDYVRSDVYAIPDRFDGCFDLVYFSAGALGWLPDLPRLFARAGALLRPGGRILIHEIHPVSEMLPFDDQIEADPLQIAEPYFKPEPYVEYGGLDYVGGTEHVSALPQYWFVHTLGAIVTGLVQAGMAIVSLEECPRDISAGHRRQEQAAIAIPLSYLLLAAKPDVTSSG